MLLHRGDVPYIDSTGHSVPPAFVPRDDNHMPSIFCPYGTEVFVGTTLEDTNRSLVFGDVDNDRHCVRRRLYPSALRRCFPQDCAITVVHLGES